MIATKGREPAVLQAARKLQTADSKLPTAKKSVLTMALLNNLSGRKVVDIRPMQLNTEKFETITDCMPHSTYDNSTPRLQYISTSAARSNSQSRHHRGLGSGRSQLGAQEANRALLREQSS